MLGDRASQRVGVADGRDHREPEAGQQPGQTFAEQHTVLGEDDPVDGARLHGSSTRTRVGPPAGLRQRSIAADHRDPVGQPGQPGAARRIGPAAPVVA